MTDVRPVSAPTSPTHHQPSPAPSPAHRSEAYRSEAGRYDQRTDAFRHWRELLIQQLPARRGDTVLDAGCGTGLCLPLLPAQGRPHRCHHRDRRLRADAPGGRRPRRRARLGQRPPDRRPGRHRAHRGDREAAVFCAVLDLMQSSAAVDNVFEHLRPGAPAPQRAASSPARGCGRCGSGSPSYAHRSSPTSPASTSRGDSWPTHPDLHVRELAFGAGYLALGHANGR
jgi:hypothetical protein